MLKGQHLSEDLSQEKPDLCFQPDTLPETKMFAPKNGWLEYDPFLLGRPIFRGFCC